MKSIKKVAGICGIALSLFVSGCSNSEPAATPDEEKKTPVKVGEVAIGPLTVEETIIGKVKASNVVDVVPKVSGELLEVYVTKGSEVQKGDVIAKLDTEDLATAVKMQEVSYRQATTQVENAKISEQQARNGVENARASLRQAELNLEKATNGQRTGTTNASLALEEATIRFNQAKANLDRMTTLVQAGAVSQQAFEDAKNAHDQARLALDQAKTNAENAKIMIDVRLVEQQVDQARIAVSNAEQQLQLAKVGIKQAQAGVDSASLNVKQARDQLKDGNLKALASGEITVINQEVGEMLTPNAPFVTIVTLDDVVIEGTLSANQLALFTVDQDVTVEIPALQKTVTAKVSYIASVANEAGFYTVEAVLTNSEKEVKPGMLAKFIKENEVTKESILVPTEAIVEQGGKSYVYRIEDGISVQKEVTVIQAQTELSAVEGDLTEGDQIVIKGQNTLTDGNNVEIMEEGR